MYMTATTNIDTHAAIHKGSSKLHDAENRFKIHLIKPSKSLSKPFFPILLSLERFIYLFWKPKIVIIDF